MFSTLCFVISHFLDFGIICCCCCFFIIIILAFYQKPVCSSQSGLPNFLLNCTENNFIVVLFKTNVLFLKLFMSRWCIFIGFCISCSHITLIFECAVRIYTSTVKLNTLQSLDDLKSKRETHILCVYIHRKQVSTVLYILLHNSLLWLSPGVISLHHCVYECIWAICAYV